MSRYIEQEYIGRVISNLPTKIFSTENSITLVLSTIEVINAIKKAPSINIVYCRECKHRINDDSFASGHICLKRRANGGAFCEDDDFCSYGEVK